MSNQPVGCAVQQGIATLTTHILNVVDGSHAAAVRTELWRVDGAARSLCFSTVTDDGGRWRETVATDTPDGRSMWELMFYTAEYFAHHGTHRGATDTLREVVFRLSSLQPGYTYHIPLMLAPSGYSVWCSARK